MSGPPAIGPAQLRSEPECLPVGPAARQTYAADLQVSEESEQACLALQPEPLSLEAVSGA